MKDKTDKKIERIITAILVISGVITLILMAISGVRKGGEIFLIVLVPCTIAVGVLYFPVKWGYNGFKRICVPALKRIYAKDKFFFRLMVVLFMFTILIPIGVIFGIYAITNQQPNNLIGGFVASTIIAYIFLFTIGQVLYFTFKSFLNGSKRELFYLRLTMVFSFVITIISTFIAAIDVSDLTTFYDDETLGGFGKRSIAEHIDIYGVWRTIERVEIILNITTIFVAAISCASVWILYLSIFWIYRGLDSDDTE